MQPREMVEMLIQRCEFPWEIVRNATLVYTLNMRYADGIFSIRAAVDPTPEDSPEEKIKAFSSELDSKLAQHLQEKWNG